MQTPKLCRLVFSFGFTCWMAMVNQHVYAEDCVQFDIPQTIESIALQTDTPIEGERLVQIMIPVSALVVCKNDRHVDELFFQIRGLGKGIQVVDYSPRTQTYSDVEGTISIEQRTERNANIGLDATGSGSEIVRIQGQANTRQLSANSEKYQRIPEQKLLLSSGTIDRSMGVYFKFRHSPQTTLEGGQEILLTLRVPSSWRGGMLRVDCVASGSEKYLIGEGRFVAGQSSFVVATWLNGDQQAKDLVQRYSQLESDLRNMIGRQARRVQKQRNNDPLAALFGLESSEFPRDWESNFMLYNSRSIQDQVKPRLPDSARDATDQFLAIRRGVLNLGR